VEKRESKKNIPIFALKERREGGARPFFQGRTKMEEKKKEP